MHLMTFSIIGKNQEACTEIKNALFGSANSRLLTECDDQDQLIADVLRVRPSAAIIVLEINRHEEQFSLIKQLAAAAPETAIITASLDASPSTILGSIRAGAHEFLQLPIDNSEFQTVLERISKRPVSSDAGAKNQRVIAVFSGKGGAGVSFL